MTRSGPELGLLRLSVATARRRRQTRAQALALAGALDWELLLALLCRGRLVSQLGPHILELDAEQAPASFAEGVARSIAETRRQGALLSLLSVRLSGALGRAGIRALILKGALLGEALYGDPGRRAAADVDILVSPGDLAAAREVLQEAGYTAVSGHLGADGLPLLHHLLVHEHGALPPVELHWRVHWYERRFAADMLERSVAGRDGVRRATGADELVGLLLFYARDGFVNLRLATDVGAWWDAFGTGLQRGCLTETVERYPALEKALLAALRVGERLVGLPADWLLDPPRRLGARARLAARAAELSARASAEQLSADISFVDCLLAPRASWRELLARQLLPPRAVLNARSRAREERNVSPVGHCLRMLGRYALTVMRLAGLSRHAHRRPFSLPRSTSSSPL